MEDLLGKQAAAGIRTRAWLAFVWLSWTLIAGCQTGEAAFFGPPQGALGNLVVYAEPNVPPAGTRRALEKAHQTRAQLLDGPLAPLARFSSKRTITMGVFRNAKSYQAFIGAPGGLRVLAHFSRKSMRIYLPYDAPEEAFRHEISHAIIETAHPGAPFWIHEGIAGFAQLNGAKPDCQKPRQAALPIEHLIAVRQHLQAHSITGETIATQALPAGFSCSTRRRSEDDRLLASYVILFLWQEQQYAGTLEAWKPGTDPQNMVTGARSCVGFANAFYDWLQSKRPQAAAVGC